MNKKLSADYTFHPRVKRITRTQPESNTLFVLFGVSALQGGSLASSSTTKNHQKIICFQVEDFLSRRFLTLQGTKRSQSCRIDEYFNEDRAEIFR
ncbi:MAG: hypothetical protein ACI4GB_00545 [Acutalibacteraceae bacterium]